MISVKIRTISNHLTSFRLAKAMPYVVAAVYGRDPMRLQLCISRS